MKKLFILLMVLLTVSSACRKRIKDPIGCWACAIEGNYNGKLVDVDTSMCNMNQAQINEFMSPHNANGQVITCTRIAVE